MLTKGDLKQIKNVMQEVVPSMIRKEVEPLIKRGVEPLIKDVKTVKKDIAKIRKDTNMIISVFDNEYLTS